MEWRRRGAIAKEGGQEGWSSPLQHPGPPHIPHTLDPPTHPRTRPAHSPHPPAQVGSENLYLTSGRAAVTTTLSGAAACLVALVSSLWRTGAWDLLAVCNGALVGFVSITAGAAVLEPWAALIAGAVGAVIFDVTCWLWLKWRIDDPLSASPMHGVCGAWGIIVTGLLAAPHYVSQVRGGWWRGGRAEGRGAEGGCGRGAARSRGAARAGGCALLGGRDCSSAHAPSPPPLS